ncbi:MAG: sigma 54-interacting transcriptional regulator [Bacillota bacterium]|nr:sigma 54-interacting transcriptional regulator [Bacillota bacterium]
MKSIAIVSDSMKKNNRPSNVGKNIKNNIQRILSNTVIINNYYIDDLNLEDKINEDLIIIMARSRAFKLRNYVKDKNNIIVANRTFLKSSIEQLSSIPENSDVLVVNDNIETVLESVSTLYSIGIKHINLIPFETGKDYHHINYAISPSEPEFIPNYIENVYNLKDRVIDIPTMLLIINHLEINTKEIQQNLYNYYQKIYSTNYAIRKNYDTLLTRTEELDHLLDLSHDGILLTDTQGKIIIANKKFKDIFNINSVIIDQYLHDVIDNINFKSCYNYDSYENLITYKKKYINYEKKDITHFNKKIRMYFSFQEVTYIKKLEQNLSKKLRQKGHIAKYEFKNIISESDEMKKIIKIAKKIAKTDLTVLITGESGTGKEVLAQAIHNASSRKKQPFIAINGAAIPENLLESELFGYESGSFTGASKTGKRGLFEKANNGTIFLDEIGDMPSHLQSKLLRVLQEQQIAPIGSDSIIDIDVRIIAATNKNPIKMIETGTFRKDLFYRLNVFSLELPPLRNRKDDIPILLNHFTNNKFICSKKCTQLLKNYNWPGNIRELSNIAKYVTTLEESNEINAESLPNYLVSQITNLNEKNYDDSSYSVIKEKLNEDSAYQILKTIEFLNKIKKTAGRKHILESLKNRNIKITENYLRKSLKIFKEENLIIIKKGRSGCYITKLGEEYLSIVNIQGI